MGPVFDSRIMHFFFFEILFFWSLIEPYSSLSSGLRQSRAFTGRVEKDLQSRMSLLQSRLLIYLLYFDLQIDYISKLSSQSQSILPHFLWIQIFLLSANLFNRICTFTLRWYWWRRNGSISSFRITKSQFFRYSAFVYTTEGRVCSCMRIWKIAESPVR